MRHSTKPRVSRPSPLKTVSAALILGAGALLAGCERHTDETVGQTLDRGIQTTERKAQQAASTVRQTAHDTAKDASQAMRDAARQSGNALDDAAISATVKTELVRDPELSALGINVDTAKGEVTLRGEADSAADRERATRVASSVQGVTKVNNELSIKNKN